MYIYSYICIHLYIYIRVYIMMYSSFCYQMQRPCEVFIVDKLVKKGENISVAEEYSRLQTWFAGETLYIYIYIYI